MNVPFYGFSEADGIVVENHRDVSFWSLHVFFWGVRNNFVTRITRVREPNPRPQHIEKKNIPRLGLHIDYTGCTVEPFPTVIVSCALIPWFLISVLYDHTYTQFKVCIIPPTIIGWSHNKQNGSFTMSRAGWCWNTIQRASTKTPLS